MSVRAMMEEKPEQDGKVAVITGGASGIGINRARLFARKGTTLLLLDLDERITERFGRIDILCNIAGLGHSSHPEEILKEGGNKVLPVNLMALFFVSQKIGRQMIRQRSGG